jgi:hypothetical protein
MSFANFLLPLHVTKSPRGDFIADAKMLISCGRFPVVTNWSELYLLMRTRNACPEAIAEARKLWRTYSKSMTPETAQ